jgi:hypothetical protein
MDDGYAREILRLVQRLPPLTREQFRALTLGYRNGGHAAEVVVAEHLYFENFEKLQANPASLARHKIRVLARAFGRRLGEELLADEKKR